MALDERYQWVIGEEAGAEDVHGRPRTIGVGIQNGRVIVDIRGWSSLPNHVADQLAYHLQSAAETNRQRERRSRPDE